MSRRIANRRMPVSCENCRRRKIACSGGRSPCQTCIRRGLASTCYFLKESMSRIERPETLCLSERESLANRVATLERLLQDGTTSLRHVPTRSMEVARQSNTLTQPVSRTYAPSYIQRGRLVYSSSGHVHFVLLDNAFDELNRETMPNTMTAKDTQQTAFPFSFDASATTSQVFESLPPFSYCDELKNIFMEVFSPLFHVLHDPSFEEEYAVFRQNPKETPLSFLALVYVVLAIAVTALDEDHHLLADLGRETTASSNIRTIAARFQDAAMRTLCADHFLWRHNLRTLQALILLIYAISHSHGPTWSLLGTTLNIAIAIGCHVDPSRYDVSVIEGEERRRCWSALTMLYMIQNTCMGNLSPISIEADTEPPADVEDEVLSSMQLEGERGGGQAQRASVIPSKMTYILHKFRLYRLASEICRLSASAQWDYDTALTLERRITAEEVNQQDQFRNFDLLPIYHQAHHFILSNYTNHLYVVLYRPCLLLLTKDQDLSIASSVSRITSIQRLSQASCLILRNFETLHSTPKYRPYKWYTNGLGSFHAFLAATTLATILGNSFTRTLIDRSLVISQLRHCLVRLEQAGQENEISAKAASTLRHFVGPEVRNDRSHRGQSNDFGRASANDHSVVDTARQPPMYRPSGSTNGSDWVDHPGAGSVSDQDAIHHLVSTPLISSDEWTADPDLISLFYQIPSQQCLSPSSFPWWRWNEAETVPVSSLAAI